MCSASLALSPIAIAVLGASAFACADLFSRIVFMSGTDVTTASTFRSFVGLAILYACLRVGKRPEPLHPRAKWISVALGLLFTGNVLWLFEAIATLGVPIAILTYFVYPLLTGLAAAATGLDSLSWRGGAAAVAAFFGLALMIGAEPSGPSAIGIAAALAAAGCRVGMLLVTRAELMGADARLVTWYSMVASTALFALMAIAARPLHTPGTALGWVALVALGVMTTLGIICVYASTVRIGPFRAALVMNLEPLLATSGSGIVLREMITPLQAAGAAVMLAALVAFQKSR